MRRSPLILAAGAVLIGATAVAAGAAVPTSGAVIPTAPVTTWSAGPFLVANPSGAATGTPVCNAALPCDDFALTVTTPAGYGTDHDLKITVSWGNTAADFDVYLLDAAGNTVTAAASSADPEVVLAAPTSGGYTVRVVPFAPLGQSISGRAELVAKAPNPPPSTEPPPGYRSYPAPEALPDAHNSGEPSIGVNRSTNATLYQSLFSTYRVTFDSAGNASWADGSATAATGCPQGGLFTLDPILFTDPRTGRTFESQLSGKTALTCYTDNDGVSWAPTQGSGINSGVDHQTIGGGPYSAGGIGPLPGTTYPNAVYYCSQDIADASCAISRDGGVTYGPAVPMYSLLDCGGLHGHAKVAPDGTLYVPNKGCGGNQAVAVSTDNATTFAVRRNPFSLPGDSDPSVGIGANGTVYLGYQNADGTPRVAVSRDRGVTWTDDQNVGQALGIQNTVFPVVVAGDDDRAAFAFLGSTTGGNYQDAANFHGEWHLYIATTYDGGRSWVTVDATPTDPVQKGSICTAGTTCGNDRNLLDFNDVTLDSSGRVEVAYADGCTGACASGGAQNFDALATITRQSGGRTLYAAFDPLPNLAVSGLSATRSSGRLSTTVTVVNTGTAPATNVRVSVQVNGTTVGTAGPANFAPGQSRTFVISGSKIQPGTYRISAIADSANAVTESNETNNRREITATL